MSSLSEKVAIITGASSGIGEAIALAMAAKGAYLTLCGRDQKRLDTATQKCLQRNNNHPEYLLALTGDVTSNEHRREIVQRTIKKFGRLDILIPNAGIALPGLTIESTTEEQYDKVMDTNLKSVFFLIQEATPHLQESKGVIVCMSSVYSTIPTTWSMVYNFGKAAMDQMVRCLAVALGPKGIRVNAIKPSYIPTEITRHYPNHSDLPISHSKNEGPKHPFEGRCGTAEEIAEATLFLASSAASFVTGECLHVDGGRQFNGESI